MRQFSRTAWQISNAVPPIDIMAATMSSSSARLRPIRTIGRNRCCLLAAVTAGFSPLTMPRHPIHEKIGGGVGGARPILPAMNLRLISPELIVDIGEVAELRGITVSRDVLKIGALTRHVD